MKKQIYVLLFALASNVSMFAMQDRQSIGEPRTTIMHLFSPTFNELNLFDTTDEESKWTFMEKKFVTDIYAAKKITWSQVSAAVPAAVAAFAGYQYATDSIADYAPTKQNVYVLTGGALATALLSAQFMEHYLHQQAHRKVLMDFFNNWNIYKFYVPDALWIYLNTVAQAAEINSDIITNHAAKIVKDVQDMIARHFESRYKKLLEIEAVNNLSDAKTASEIFKNVVGTAKDLGV